MGRMLESSQIEVSAGTNLIVMTNTQGYLQGGVLPLVIWSIVVDELLAELTNTLTQLTLF